MVQGLRSLQNKLTRKIPDAVRRATIEVLEQNADEIVAYMKSLAPVDSGGLRASIGWTWGSAPAGAMVVGTVAPSKGDTLRITIFAGGTSETKRPNKSGFVFDVARLQEFGTADMPPSPFFFPAYRAKKSKAKSRVTRRLRKAIRSGAK